MTEARKRERLEVADLKLRGHLARRAAGCTTCSSPADVYDHRTKSMRCASCVADHENVAAVPQVMGQLPGQPRWWAD